MAALGMLIVKTRTQLPSGLGSQASWNLLLLGPWVIYGNISSKNNYFPCWKSDVTVAVTGIRTDGSQSKYNTFSKLEPKERTTLGGD